MLTYFNFTVLANLFTTKCKSAQGFAGYLEARLKRILRSCLVLAFSMTFFSLHAEARQIKALVLSQDNQFPQNLITALCKTNSLACPLKPAQVFRDKNKKIYFIDNDNLTFMSVDLAGKNKISISGYWDFSSFQPSSPIPYDDRSKISIYPALYPVAEKTWALALVISYSEAYAGGGGWFQVADFVILKQDQSGVGTYAVLYETIPFSCAKQLRACFSEEEHKKSPHCIEESSGILRIAFSQEKKAPRFKWQFTWEDWCWPAHVPETKSKGTSQRFEPSERVSFCGGFNSGDYLRE